MGGLAGSLGTSVVSGIMARRSNRRNQANVAAGLSSFQPSGFSSGGLTGQFQDNQFNIANTGLAQGLTQQGSAATNQRIGDLQGFAGQLDPLMGAVTQAGVQSLRNTSRRTIGNLSQQLQRRRVLGSSFAQDAINRAQAEFGQREAELQSQMALQSLQAQAQLTDQANQARIQDVQSQIAQMNFESGLAAQLSGQATSALNANAQLNAQLQANLGQQETDLYGSVFGAGLTGLGRSLGGTTQATVGGLGSLARGI